jgi:hypothetical protein
MNLAALARADALSIQELGHLLGDSSFDHVGDKGRRLYDDANDGKLAVAGGASALSAMAYATPVTREQFARYVAKHRPDLRGTTAERWGHGVGRNAFAA